MTTATRRRLGQLLDDAERERTCLILSKGDLRETAKRLTKKGFLVRPLRGMYARSETWNSLKPDARQIWKVRALQSLHPDWKFCGVTAALLHGLSVSYQLLNEVQVLAELTDCASKTAGIRTVRTDGSSIVDIDGVRVTSIERTVFDCARWLSLSDGLAVADSAIRCGRATKEALLNYVLDVDQHNQWAAHAYATLLFSDGRAESGGESLARARMLELGFALPDLQTEVRDPMNPWKTYRLDFCWRMDDRTIIGGELDGREKYENIAMLAGNDTIGAFTNERLRESRITAYGIKMLRFSYRQMNDDSYFSELLSSFGVPRVGTPRVLASKRAAVERYRHDRAHRYVSKLYSEGVEQLEIDGVLVQVEVLYAA